MKTHNAQIGILALSLPVLILLLPVANVSADPQGQPLSLQIQSIITNAGSQQYSISGGTIIAGQAMGTVLGAGTNLEYSLSATVSGLTTTGQASIQIVSGTFRLHANLAVNGEVPAAIFPLDSSFNNCDPSVSQCNSQIPLLFTGIATITTSSGWSGQLPMAIESAYWNPFGGPIVITSLDSPTSPSVFIVASYSQASINWSGVEVDGIMAGTVGTNPVTGLYTSQTKSFEDLLAGQEFDSGTITFASTTGPLPSITGTFSGSTTIPTAGSFDCSSLLGLPEGTCTATGALSNGSFKIVDSHNVHVTGSYSTVWSVPSLTTVTTVTGSVTGK